MKKYASWSILLLAIIALSALFWAEDHGQLALSSKTTAIALCVLAIVLLATQRRRTTISNLQLDFLPDVFTGVPLLVTGITLILISVAWLLVSLLRDFNEYLIVIPFSILFFGGAAIIGAWVAFRSLKR